jgi:hypothetical protein
MKAGDRFVTDAGMAITPIKRKGTVIWDDGENIHYRLDGDVKVKQTPSDRFEELAKAIAD